jgi:hypothetical protein
MIKATVAIEVDGDRMSMAVVITERASVLVSAGQLWTMDSMTVARTPNDGTVE